tara:strand:- start:9771 stop:10028 length:258 start_codon:yes stop_codon:yes gene_type:complete
MLQSTSLEAYENKKPKIKNDHQRILFMMSKKEDFTYNEIAKMLGWSNPNKVSRRIPELIREGKVKVKEVRKCTVAGSNCNSYLKV